MLKRIIRGRTYIIKLCYWNIIVAKPFNVDNDINEGTNQRITTKFAQHKDTTQLVNTRRGYAIAGMISMH